MKSLIYSGFLNQVLGQLISFDGFWGELINIVLPMTKGTFLIRELIGEGGITPSDYAWLTIQSFIFLTIGLLSFSYYFMKLNNENGFTIAV